MVAYLLVLGSDRGQEEQRQQALLQGLALPLKSKEMEITMTMMIDPCQDQSNPQSIESIIAITILLLQY